MTPSDAPHTHPREAIAERNLGSILDAAERLLARQEAPTVSAVAGEAGVSRPTVYAHFPDRQQLLEALVERTVRRATSAIESADPGSGEGAAALERVIAAAWEQLGRHEDIARASAAELGADAMHRAHGSAHAVLAKVVRRGQRDGSIRADLPAGWIVASVLALIHAAADEVRRGTLERRRAADVLLRSTAALVGPAAAA